MLCRNRRLLECVRCWPSTQVIVAQRKGSPTDGPSSTGLGTSRQHTFWSGSHPRQILLPIHFLCVASTSMNSNGVSLHQIPPIINARQIFWQTREWLRVDSQLSSCNTAEVNRASVDSSNRIPDRYRRTMTFGNGTEFYHFREMWDRVFV